MQSRDFIKGTTVSAIAWPPTTGRYGYRPDIDGLRGLAVLSVVAYHFDIGRLPGGFIGVDIFFVISGYLITDIITSHLNSGSFSFIGFYRRRIRRIFPALLLVLAAYFVVAFFTLTSSEAFSVTETTFQNICWAVLAGAAFFTNFAQLHDTNYFAQTAASSPLLHLWSLSIEEQFYIAWPLLLFGIRTIRTKYLPFIVAVLAISFCINVLTVHAEPMIAFYSPFSRAWELMLGAALACLPLETLDRFLGSSNARSAVGLLVIVLGLFVINWKSMFPGWWALLPTVGTALVISADRDAFANQHIFGGKFLVWIGLISYPLYLWHWPALLLYQKYAALLATTSFGRPALKATAVCCAIGASWLTFRFVEVPVRFGKWRSPHPTVGIALIMAAIGIASAAAPSIVIFAAPLTPHQRETMTLLRRAADIAKTSGDISCFQNSMTDSVTTYLRDGCVVAQRPGAKTVFLIGDSHSAALSVGLRPLLKHSGVNFLQVSTGFPCEPTTNNHGYVACSDINNMAIDKISTLRPDLVVIDSFWSKASTPPSFVGGGEFFGHLLAKLQDIERRGAKRILIVGQIPTWPPSLPENLAQNFVERDIAIPKRTFVGVDQQSLRMDVEMRNIKFSPAVTYISVRDALCNDFGCLTAVGSDLARDLVVYDHSHLTPAASEFLARSLMAPAFSSLLDLD